MIRHIVYSNIWISTGSIFLLFNFYFLNQIPVDFNVVVFVFSATLFTYNFQRIVKIKTGVQISGERFDWMSKYYNLSYTLLLISFIPTAYYAVLYFSSLWWVLLICGFLSFFYVWKLPGFKDKSLRDLPGIKIYLISVVWVLISVFMPYLLLNHNTQLENTQHLFIAEVLFMISITIPFDIRDIQLDEKSKRTIPQLIGIKKSQYLAAGLLIISQCILQSLYTFNLGIWIFTGFACVVLFYAKAKSSELYFSGLTDGLLILQFILLYAFN